MSFKYSGFSIGEGQPIVFQHGLAANAEQIKSLLGGVVDIKLMCIDCPGHGKTMLDDFNPSFNNYADLVIQFMNDSGVDKAIVGGLSMGAGIAINIALRYPDKVRALIVHRPAWLASSNPVSLSMLKETLSFMDDANAKEKFQATEVYKSIADQLPKAAESLMGVFAEGQQAGLPQVIKQMVEDQPFSNIINLKSIKVPTLIIANDDDPIHPYSMAVEIHKAISQSKLKKVTSRYIDDEEHKTQVRNIITTFIKEID